MRLLIDTHIAVWSACYPALLSHSERAVLNDERIDFFVSAVAIWEMRLKWDSYHPSGDRKGPKSPLEILEAFDAYGLPIIALEPTHAATPLEAALPHKDPFDDLLLVQAQVLQMRLFTRDGKLRGHPLAFYA